MILFSDKLTIQKGMASLLTFLGCVFVTGLVGEGAGDVHKKGIIIGIGSGIGYALYSIFGRFVLNKGYDSVTISLYTFVFAALGAVSLSRLDKMGDLDWSLRYRCTLQCLSISALH